MIVRPMTVWKYTRKMVLNMYLSHPKRGYSTQVLNNDIVLVTS